MVTGFLLPCGARAVRTVSSESDWHFEARSPESRLSSASPTTSGQCPLCRSSSMSRPLLVLASCLLLLGFTSVADGAEEAIKCTIPGDQPGKCIPSYECSPYEEALTYITVTNIEFLRHSQCKVEGNTALVCCPDSGNYTFTDIPKPTKRRVRPPPANSLLANRFGDNTLPSNDDCGKQAAPNRIFDGIVTGIDEFPWMALFAYKRRYADGKPVLACGGALISSRYVLTAAHCVSGEGFDKLQGIDKIRLGEYNIESDEDCVIEKDYQDCSEPVVERSAQEIIVHPDYEVASKHQYNDIALVRLDAPVLFSDFIQPICLPDTKTFNFTVKEGEVMLVAGWGRTERARNSPIKLKLGVPIVKNEHCGHSYKRFGIDVGHGQAKYEPTWLSSLTPCSDLDAKQFDASNLVLRKESATITVLSGDFEILKEIPEGIEIKVTVEKDTPLGKEFMYLLEDDFCSHLSQNDRPWSPFFDAFNLETRGCPIPAKKYSLGDIRLDLGFADHMMTKEFVGEYVATVVFEHPGLDLGQGKGCLNLAIGIEEIRDEAEKVEEPRNPLLA